MLVILKKTCFDLIMPRYFPICQSKEMSHDFVRGQSVAATGATDVKHKAINIFKSYTRNEAI